MAGDSRAGASGSGFGASGQGAGKGAAAANGGGGAGTGTGGTTANAGGSAGSGSAGSDTGGSAGAVAEAGQSGAGTGGATADASAELFDPARLPRFDITLSADAVAGLGSAPDTYVRGTLRYGSTTVENVGVRIKGEASLRTLSQKAAFKLKFDEFVTNQAFMGLHRLTLNNMVSDPTFIAERLAYRVFVAAGLPAPRCNSALVYVNDEFYGVYANVESEDKPFLRRWFADDSGNLYEDGQVDFTANNEKFFDLETNTTKNDRSDLTRLIAALDLASGDSYLTTLDAELDTDHYLHFAALEGLLNQWDGYSYTYFEPNNFRVYHDPTRNKFVLLPWGLDLTLKPFPYSSSAQIPLFKVPRYQDDVDPNNQRDAGGLLLKKCFESAACKTRYAAVLREVLTLYGSLQLEALAAQHYAQIKEHVYAETRAEYTPEQFEAAYQSLLSLLHNRAAAVQSDLTAAGL
ncbi:MAG: hypothetical protein RL701_7910 [Pseudomonadota bacterium]